MTEQSTPYVGRSLRRREDRKFLTGRGRYVDDIALPGMPYLAIFRSPHAHARVAGIDLSAAREAGSRAIILRSGLRHFSAGADVSLFDARSEEGVLTLPATAERGGSGLRSSTILN